VRSKEQLTSRRITGTIFWHRYLSLSAHHRSFKRTTVSTRTPIMYDRVTVYASRWFVCLWSQIIHVFEKFRHVFIASIGECFGFLEFRIYLHICSFLLS